VILQGLQVTADEFEARTGWAIKPEGACKDERCVPLGGMDGSALDVRQLADKLHMPLVHDDEHDLWCLGPESNASVLGSAQAPDLVLLDWQGKEFALASLHGTKVLLLAWASW
jgi:hypothetical protein